MLNLMTLPFGATLAVALVLYAPMLLYRLGEWATARVRPYIYRLPHTSIRIHVGATLAVALVLYAPMLLYRMGKGDRKGTPLHLPAHQDSRRGNPRACPGSIRSNSSL